MKTSLAVASVAALASATPNATTLRFRYAGTDACTLKMASSAALTADCALTLKDGSAATSQDQLTAAVAQADNRRVDNINTVEARINVQISAMNSRLTALETAVAGNASAVAANAVNIQANTNSHSANAWTIAANADAIANNTAAMAGYHSGGGDGGGGGGGGGGGLPGVCPPNDWHCAQISRAAMYGADWQPFWWYDGTGMSTNDVLGTAYGSCDLGDAACYGRLPYSLNKDNTEMLAMDSAGNVFKYDFASSTTTAQRAFAAFQSGTITDITAGTGGWNPTVLAGTHAGQTDQDTFVYREQDGIKSVLLDDDTCDCHSSLSMGASICGSTNGWGYNGGVATKGVDVLSDNGCSTPQESRKLMLFFRSVSFTDFDTFCAGDSSWHCAKSGAFPERHATTA